MTDLSARQRRHVLATFRRELELYGSLPSLHKRHKLRVADRMAEMYGLTRRDVLKIWTDWVQARVAAVEKHQREAFAARVANGTTSTCHAVGYSHISTVRPQRR